MNRQNWNGTAFPEIFEADDSAILVGFLSSEREAIDAVLEEAGAILFRGFDVATVDDFDAAILVYDAENFPYAESLSNAVRINLTPRVFTANEAPPETSIYLHHEMAQTPIYPSKLFFYCNVAADKGGATPLCRSDILLARLTEEEPDLVEEFIVKGVRYTNIMPAADDPGSGQGRSWQSTFNTDDKDGAEARLDALGYDWAWLEGDILRVTSPRLDAVRVLADGRTVFFNQLIAAFRGWADRRNDPSKSICYGDGTPIAAANMATAIRLADELSYDLEWQAGDVVLVNNFLVMHGRRPFQGTRKVLASLIK